MLCYRCGSHVQDEAEKCWNCGTRLQSGANGSPQPDARERQRTRSRVSGVVYKIGDLIANRYQVRDIAGSGGAGVVYRARDQEIDVDVGLKVINAKLLQTPEERRLFSKEVKVAKKLSHQNIVRIFDEGKDGDRAFYTMQYLEGLSLRKIIDLRKDKGQTFRRNEIEPIFNQLCQALEHSGKSTIHGDLKPDNVIVLPDLLKVTDFGMLLGLPRKPFLAIQKSRGANLKYLAPEVRLEVPELTSAADLYSLGVILHEMLTGKVYDDSKAEQLNIAVQGLSPDMVHVLRRCLSRSPKERYASPLEMHDDLRKPLLRPSIEAPPRSPSVSVAPEAQAPAPKPPTPPPPAAAKPPTPRPAPVKSPPPPPPAELPPSSPAFLPRASAPPPPQQYEIPSAVPPIAARRAEPTMDAPLPAPDLASDRPIPPLPAEGQLPVLPPISAGADILAGLPPAPDAEAPTQRLDIGQHGQRPVPEAPATAPRVIEEPDRIPTGSIEVGEDMIESAGRASETERPRDVAEGDEPTESIDHLEELPNSAIELIADPRATNVIQVDQEVLRAEVARAAPQAPSLSRETPISIPPPPVPVAKPMEEAATRPALEPDREAAMALQAPAAPPALQAPPAPAGSMAASADAVTRPALGEVRPAMNERIHEEPRLEMPTRRERISEVAEIPAAVQVQTPEPPEPPTIAPPPPPPAPEPAGSPAAHRVTPMVERVASGHARPQIHRPTERTQEPPVMAAPEDQTQNGKNQTHSKVRPMTRPRMSSMRTSGETSGPISVTGLFGPGSPDQTNTAARPLVVDTQGVRPRDPSIISPVPSLGQDRGNRNLIIGIGATALIFLALFTTVFWMMDRNRQKELDELRTAIETQRTLAAEAGKAEAQASAAAEARKAEAEAAKLREEEERRKADDAQKEVEVARAEAEKAKGADAEKKQKLAEEAALRAKEAQESAEREKVRRAEAEAARVEAEKKAAEQREAKRQADENERKLNEKTEALAAQKAFQEEKARRDAEKEAKKAEEEAKKKAADEKKAAELAAKKEEEAAKKAELLAKKEEEAAKKVETEKKDPKAEGEAAKAEGEEASLTAASTSGSKKCPQGMTLVGGGSFMMGAPRNDPERNFGDKNYESVDVPDFCIDYYEAPNGRGRDPTVGVDYASAERACKARKKRLCTEEEWEKACKGKDGTRFPYGNQWDPATCNTEDEDGQDREVAKSGTFKTCRSGFNVFDLSGNVAEWTASKWPSGGGYVVKGGASDRPGYDARCAARKKQKPDYKADRLGFRCCDDPE